MNILYDPVMLSIVSIGSLLILLILFSLVIYLIKENRK